jgi:hypothetical protein
MAPSKAWEKERKRRLQAVVAKYGSNRQCSGNPERWDARRDAFNRVYHEMATWVPPKDDDELARLASADTGMYVYFIQGKDGGAIKIGHAVSPRTRMALLQVGSPVELCLLGTQNGGQPLEAALHRRFAAHRLHREWFAPAPELLAYIEGLG